MEKFLDGYVLGPHFKKLLRKENMADTNNITHAEKFSNRPKIWPTAITLKYYLVYLITIPHAFIHWYTFEISYLTLFNFVCKYKYSVFVPCCHKQLIKEVFLIQEFKFSVNYQEMFNWNSCLIEKNFCHCCKFRKSMHSITHSLDPVGVAVVIIRHLWVYYLPKFR